MQTLGLSDSTPRPENRLRALFWPTIRNEGDFDYVTTQGFWICFVVGVFTTGFSAFMGSPFSGLLEGIFYFLAGVGVRQRNRAAAILAFVAYLLGRFVLQRYSGNGFGTLPLIFLALLFANIRGNWLSTRWAKETQFTNFSPRLNETLGDKLSDQLPIALWPKAKYPFYVLAGFEIAMLLLALFAPQQVQ
jgi:hypothetical protein